MDPIMKLLEDDEDESMHSGADVDAFTAALNREVEGSASAISSAAASSSQPLDHGAGILPLESNSILNPSHGQCHCSVKNETGNQESQQQEQKHLQCRNEQSSRPEGVSKGADNKHLQSNTQKECNQLKVKQEPGNNSQQSVVGQQQPMQQMKSQQTPGTNQTNSVTTAAQAQRNPQTNPSNYSLLSQVSGQQNVPSGSMPIKQAIDNPRPPQFRPSSSGQMQSNMDYPASESNLQKPNETGIISDGKGVHMLQSHPPNMHSVSVQATQHHVQPPQTSLPVFGTNNIHSRPFSQPVGGSIAQLRPQVADSSQRGQLVQGVVTTVTGSVAARPTLQTNSFTPTAHMNKETVNQRSESTQSSFAALHAKQVNPALLSSKGGGVLENQSSTLSTSKSLTTTSSSQPHRSYGTQAEPNMQIQPATQATPVVASKTSQKKPSAGQKKPLEAIGSSPPPSSKKQKVSGGFHDQSIDQLNDVTAVSGVNLREEEEQLFSAPKDESRVSEAARKVVQLEEEKLILQKGPLTKKLAEIMRKCNLKNIGSDVELCLSMCIEERLRGFVSNIIRLSKQRIDVEKSRHRFYPLSSDVRSHILRVNREAREQWDKKLSEDAERIRKQNDGDDNAVVDSEKDKNEGRGTSKHAKTYEEDDKMRTTAANAAVRVAAGGDDMLSKWQLLAERNKQRSEGGDGSSGSLPGNMSPHKPSPKSGKGSREQQEIEKRGYFSMLGPGGVRRSPHIKVARSITVKDVIAALEREPQMSNSSLLFRLYGGSPTESAAK